MGATTWPAAKSRPERNLDWRPTPLMRLRPSDFCLRSSSARFDRLPPILLKPCRTVTAVVDRMPGMKDRRTTSTSPPRSASSLSRLKFSTSGARAATAMPHAPSRFVGGGDFPRLGADDPLSIWNFFIVDVVGRGTWAAARGRCDVGRGAWAAAARGRCARSRR